MRLLHVDSFKLTQFLEDKERPRYVIASHRWQDSEVTLHDVQNGQNTHTKGYKKIVEFASYIRQNCSPIEWLWIDTCCIDKTSSQELSEAINSMFKWYRNADICIAYLIDVQDKVHYGQSEWFRRGWTLQELVAPRVVIFVTKNWEVIGNKGASRYNYHHHRASSGRGLEQEITIITTVPEHVLHDYDTATDIDIKEKLKWMDIRHATREKDLSYALFGICGVSPGANYGEGGDGARNRLLYSAKQQAKQYRKAIAWLSPPDPRTNHAAARYLYESLTGTWFTESPEHRKWRSTPAPAASTRHLWLHGKVGCGKTILCSTLIEDVREYCKTHPKAKYAMFYFTFSDKKKQGLCDLLCSLFVQLGSKQSVFSMFQQTYDEAKPSQPSIIELERALLTCLEPFNEVFFMIDALDECPEGEMRCSMLEFLARVTQQAPCVKLLATSRESPDIRLSMLSIARSEEWSLDTHFVNADIQRYVVRCMSRYQTLSTLDQNMKTSIVETISARAEGMFRWAHCQMDRLKDLKVTRPSVIRRALSSLPTSLEETYHRILTSIDEDLRKDALNLLRWLAYTEEPLSLAELIDASITNGAEDTVDINDRPGLEDPLNLLSGLVVIINDDLEVDNVEEPQEGETRKPEPPTRRQISKNTRIRLAHFSVKEYLQSTRILAGDSIDFFYLKSSREHRILSENCLTYLKYYSVSPSKLSTVEDFTTFPLLQYATKSWFYHSALQEGATSTREIAFLSDERCLRSWLLVCQPDVDHWESFTLEDNLDPVGSPLYYACCLGLEQVVSHLIKSGADVNGPKAFYASPLQACSARPNGRVVQMLLYAGADVNASNNYSASPLYLASELGHGNIVRELLSAGAIVHAMETNYESPLWIASARGHEEVVQILLESGAVPGNLETDRSRALLVASLNGHVSVVRLLLDVGADPNIEDDHFGSALQVASAHGHEKVVAMLLAKGAHVGAQGRRTGGALFAGSRKGHENLIRMPQAAKADV